MLPSPLLGLLSRAGRLTGHVGAPASPAALAAARRRSVRPGGGLDRLLRGAPAPGVRVFDLRTDEGVALRVFTPAVEPGEELGVVLHAHGGGFVRGGVHSAPWWCSAVAAATPAVVVSVAYRLAPEHPFPAGADDCLAAVRWVAHHGEHVGRLSRVDVSQLALMGHSAGGSLAAVTALRLRDEPRSGDPRIVNQSLVYPATDATLSSPSVSEHALAPFLSAADLQTYYRLYTHGLDGRQRVALDDPGVSPLLAHSHAGLPPATILVAEHDPLRDDGRRYSQALVRDGVPVRLTEYPGAVHGFASLPRIDPVRSQHAVMEVAGSLRAAFEGVTSPLPPVWV